MNETWLADAQRRLLETIAGDAHATASWTGRDRFSDRVMTALAHVPRHAFVAERDLRFAYDNRPLSIGHGQTISQPYIVAVMTDLLDLTATDRVLEIGTGCGYQTAVLAALAAHVYSIERVPDLAMDAADRLHDLGYENVTTRCGDGYLGWPEAAPFDAIIVTAAAPELPPALAEQLRPGGRIVIPIGGRYDAQDLCRGVRTESGRLHLKRCLPVAFVPLVHVL